MSGGVQGRATSGLRARARASIALAAVVAAISIAACGGGLFPGGSEAPSARPTASVVATSAPTTRPSPAPTAGQTPSSPPSTAPSPRAELETAAGPIPGTLGSWALDGQGSDSPWLRAAALRETTVAGSPLRIRAGDRAAIGTWSARAAPASDPTGERAIGLGEREAAEPPLDAVDFGAPPAGRWVVAVRLDRADGRGDATFYWLLRVE